MTSVAGDRRNWPPESLSQEVTDNDRCWKVLMSTGILAGEVQLAEGKRTLSTAHTLRNKCFCSQSKESRTLW